MVTISDLYFTTPRVFRLAILVMLALYTEHLNYFHCSSANVFLAFRVVYTNGIQLTIFLADLIQLFSTSECYQVFQKEIENETILLKLNYLDGK